MTREQIGGTDSTFTYDPVWPAIEFLSQGQFNGAFVTQYAYDAANQTTPLVGGLLGDSEL